jgi:hypothetical protein
MIADTNREADMSREADMNTELMLDGSALGGMLYDIFGADVTAAGCECAACGNHAELGALLAFTHAPGTVLRCPACSAVTVRVVERADAYLMDARGLAWMRLERTRQAEDT